MKTLLSTLALFGFINVQVSAVYAADMKCKKEVVEAAVKAEAVKVRGVLECTAIIVQ